MKRKYVCTFSAVRSLSLVCFRNRARKARARARKRAGSIAHERLKYVRVSRFNRYRRRRHSKEREAFEADGEHCAGHIDYCNHEILIPRGGVMGVYRISFSIRSVHNFRNEIVIESAETRGSLSDN